MALGHRADEPDETRFNMAVMGLRLAGRSNGVAALHGAVSREMFQGLWPDVPVDEVPIGSITNGVHAHTWVSNEIDTLLRSSVGGMWDGADEAAWERVDGLHPGAVWAARRIGRAAAGVVRPPPPRRRPARPGRADDRLRPPLRHVQAGHAAPVPAGAAAQPAAVGRPAGAVRVRRQGPPGRPARQGHDPRHRAVRPPARRRPPLRVRPRLRHGHRPHDVPRLRRVAEQPAPPARGVRHERDEGGAERGAELQHPSTAGGTSASTGRTAGRSSRPTTTPTTSAATRARRRACSGCSSGRSSRCSTPSATACRSGGSTG